MVVLGAACLAVFAGLMLPVLFSSHPPGRMAKEVNGTQTRPGKVAQQPEVLDPRQEKSAPAGGSLGPQPAEVERADVVIQQILEANPTVETAGKSLLDSYPEFKPAEKIAAAPHIAGLLSDDQAPLLVELLKSPDSPNAAKEIFYNNLLNRPHPIAWPMLVEVIAIPNHPLGERAREMLMAVVGQDLGSSVEAWRQEVAKQLRPLE